MPKDTVVVSLAVSCRRNGPGAWSAVLQWKGRAKTLNGTVFERTPNRAAQAALLEVMRSILRPVNLEVRTSNTYLARGVMKMGLWKRLGWQRRDPATEEVYPIPNSDMWEAIIAEMSGRRLGLKTVDAVGENRTAEDEAAHQSARYMLSVAAAADADLEPAPEDAPEDAPGAGEEPVGPAPGR
jgi:ribonuclease HI